MPTYMAGAQSDLPRSVLDYLVHGAPRGERNQRLFAAACQCRDIGLMRNVTENCLLGRAIQDGLSESEIRKTIGSVYGHEAREPAHGVRSSHTAAQSAPPPPPPNGPWPSPEPLPIPTPELDLGVLMTTLFRPEEGISIGVGSKKADGQLDLDAGIVKSWAGWQKCNPPLANWNRGSGLFWRVNAMRHGGKTDKDVVALRHALLEFDLDANGQTIPKEVQFALLLKFQSADRRPDR